MQSDLPVLSEVIWSNNILFSNLIFAHWSVGWLTGLHLFNCSFSLHGPLSEEKIQGKVSWTSCQEGSWLGNGCVSSVWHGITIPVHLAASPVPPWVWQHGTGSQGSASQPASPTWGRLSAWTQKARCGSSRISVSMLAAKTRKNDAQSGYQLDHSSFISDGKARWDKQGDGWREDARPRYEGAQPTATLLFRGKLQGVQPWKSWSHHQTPTWRARDFSLSGTGIIPGGPALLLPLQTPSSLFLWSVNPDQEQEDPGWTGVGPVLTFTTLNDTKASLWIPHLGKQTQWWLDAISLHKRQKTAEAKDQATGWERGFQWQK